jgi:hypothetical protein
VIFRESVQKNLYDLSWTDIIIPTALDSVLLISFTAVQKLIISITSEAFSVTIVEQEEMLGIPLIILISNIAKSSMQFTG